MSSLSSSLHPYSPVILLSFSTVDGLVICLLLEIPFKVCIFVLTKLSLLGGEEEEGKYQCTVTEWSKVENRLEQHVCRLSHWVIRCY